MQKVSIVLPIYNTEKFLKESLDSLLNQTYKNLEIICVNDGSVDNSLCILEEYLKKDDRIRIFSQENKGVASARNFALSQCSGEYITFMDSDDIVSCDIIQKSLACAVKNDSDLVINYIYSYDYLHRKIEDFACLEPWRMFLKKEFLDKNNLKFSENIEIGSDGVFANKVFALANKISKNYAKISYKYRQHNEQITKRIPSNNTRLIENIKKWLVDLKQFYSENNLFETKQYLLMNFLMEQPLHYYLFQNLSDDEKKEIFELIHAFVNENNLERKFNKRDRRAIFFYFFLKCKSYKEYEFILFVGKIWVGLKSNVLKVCSSTFLRQ